MKHKEKKEKLIITDDKQQERRDFLKKSVYAAPSLFALGQLVKPTKADADYSVPPPPVW